MSLQINNDQKEYETHHKIDLYTVKEFVTGPCHTIFVDGEELKKCERIIGRKVENPCHIFFGDDAREIVANWNLY